MAKVEFTRHFFGPNGISYRKGVQDVPDSWTAEGAKVLPKSAKVLSEADVKPEKPVAKK
jgi:hypothetical protein